jgi:peroxiredoxin
MKKLLTPVLATAGLALALCALPHAANAALKVGDAAPDFTAQVALGGKVSTFALADALKKGPVVLYFYPKSFTSGCTVEAHLFAEATPKFAALGATVIGVSHDTIETQQKFSKEECRNAFAVAADGDSKIIKAYDAKLMMVPGMADRISYVIDPKGKVAAVYASMDPEGHVGATMKAVEAIKSAK